MLIRQVLVELSRLKRDVRDRGLSDFTIDLKLVLIFCALYHTVLHVAVLFGAHSIYFMRDSWFVWRQLYFTFDFMASPAAWAFHRKNTLMVVVHALVHIPAGLHLYGIMPTKMYADIFEMGELNYNDKSCLIIVIYVWGTTQDLLTHLINAYYLIRSENTFSLSYFSKKHSV
eukprot:21568_1